MAPITDLRDNTTFPNFSSCPRYDEMGHTYYYPTNRLHYFPCRHWCLLAEITDMGYFFGFQLMARDKAGEAFKIKLQLDGSSMGGIEFRRGSTIAILYPHQTQFLDPHPGILVTEQQSIRVIPLSMAKLLALGDRVQEQMSQAGAYACHGCGNRGAKLKCGGCGLAWYCDKECQRKGWEEKDHKGDCKVLRRIDGVFTMDWNCFQDYVGFPL